MSASDARKDFADVVNRAAYKGERIVLERRGKNVAAIVPIEDLEMLEALEDRLDLEAAKRALAEGGENVPWETLKAELGL
jgi:prevent-host-death family protein